MPNLAMGTWLDENGTTTRTSLHVDETVVLIDTLDTIVEALQACSNAKLGKVGLILEEVYAGTLGTGPYDAEDKMVLAFLDADNRTCHVVVPAPKDGCFIADDKTVDETAQIIDDLITQILITVVTAGGAALVSFIKGWRARRNRKQ